MRPFSEYMNEVIKLGPRNTASTDAYVTKVYQMGTRIRDGVRLAGAYVNLTAFAGTVVINEISLPHSAQGRGTGHKVMQMLTDLADQMGIKLQLFAKPIDQGPDKDMISKAKLTAFYKQHGFTGAGKMVREPR